MRFDYQPTQAVLSDKPVGLCRAQYDEPRRFMQGNNINTGRSWSVVNNTPVVPATVIGSDGLSRNAPASRVRRTIVPTDEGPISLAHISEPVDRVVTSSEIETVVRLDSRKLKFQPTLEIK